MQSFTVTQWAIVALVFVAGWLLGLASHPGGRKWRERYAAERDAHATYRKDADARVAAAEARHRELERDHDRVVTAGPTPATNTTVVTAAPTPATNTTVVTEAPRPIATQVVRPPASTTTTTDTGERRGWFDFGPRRS